MIIRTAVCLLGLLATTYANASSTHRCGSSLVSLNASTAEVMIKCGEPTSSALIGYKQNTDDYGFRQEVEVVEWVYGPNHGMYHFLRFEGNRLRRIESQRGQ